jgi:Mn-dependent DtxR family transcriptional regulator
MKASEALLRAIAAEGGKISGPTMDDWLGKLIKAGFLEKAPEFSYKLTENAVKWLDKKGVKVNGQ